VAVVQSDWRELALEYTPAPPYIKPPLIDGFLLAAQAVLEAEKVTPNTLAAKVAQLAWAAHQASANPMYDPAWYDLAEKLVCLSRGLTFGYMYSRRGADDEDCR